MAEYQNREHYIPIRKGDLIRLFLKDGKMSLEEHEPFEQFCKILSSIFHFEYLTQLEEFKDSYAPFDPDSETKPLFPPSPDQRDRLQDRVFDSFVSLMERANFKHLTKEDIQAAIEGGASDWGLDMDVDFNAYERFEMFVRGDNKGKRYKRSMWKLWRLEEKEVDQYQRLAFIIKLRKHKRLPVQVDTSHIFLKVFKDIPKLDLEMILPGTQMRMPKFTKYSFGGTLLGGLVGVIWQVGVQLWAAVKSLFIGGAAVAAGTIGILWAPIAGLLGFGYKQWYTYSVYRQRYTLQLTESLYFQNLDNNVGVLTRLLDEAEEQEFRETILAYFFLWKHAPEQGWTADQIDDYVEMYLEGAANLKIDFEIGDSLAKLERFKLVEQTNGHYRAVPLPQALEALDYLWDNYFQYNQKKSAATV